MIKENKKMKTKNLIISFSFFLILYYSSACCAIEATEQENTENLQGKESQILDTTQSELRKEPIKDETSASESDIQGTLEPNLQATFTIQIASFRDEANAIQTSNMAKSQLNIEVHHALMDGFYRVLAGVYPTASDALLDVSRIRNVGYFDAYVIKK
ncbi:MAG: SPOR domain-containing protein [Ignavibacteria bacterium]